MIYFADTNFFLECKSPQNLDWKNITSDTEVVLYICYPVIQEIDKHKHNPQKSRKTKRIQQLLNELLKNDKKKEYILNDTQTLIVKIANRYPKAQLKNVENLEIDIKDDEIIATVVLFNAEHEDKAVLLTHDYGMQLKAESFLDVYFVPDNWLTSEPDELQKENEKLKAELLQLQKKEPKIECNLFFNNILLQNDMKEHIKLTLYEKLTEKQIDDYMYRMVSHCPKVLNYSISYSERQMQSLLGYRYIAPSQSEIEKYYEKYGQWQKHQRYVLETFSKKHNETLLIFPVCIELKNIGTVPAESFEIEIFSNSGVFFETKNLKSYKEELIEHFHVVPEAPKSKLESYSWLRGLNSDFDPNLNPPTFLRNYRQEYSHEECHEKFAFYPFYDDGMLKIQCEEMQHQKEKYTLASYFLIDEDKIKNDRIDFSYQIYSKNLTKTKIFTHTISVDIKRISAFELIEKELKDRDCI